MRARPLLLAAVLLAGCGSNTGSLTWHDRTRDVVDARSGRPVDAPGIDIRRGMAVHHAGVLRLRLDLAGRPRDAMFAFDVVLAHHCGWFRHVEVIVPADASQPRVRAQTQMLGDFLDPRRQRLPGAARLVGTTLRAHVAAPGDARVRGIWVDSYGRVRGRTVSFDELHSPSSNTIAQTYRSIGCPDTQINVIR